MVHDPYRCQCANPSSLILPSSLFFLVFFFQNLSFFQEYFTKCDRTTWHKVWTGYNNHEEFQDKYIRRYIYIHTYFWCFLSSLFSFLLETQNWFIYLPQRSSPPHPHTYKYVIDCLLSFVLSLSGANMSLSTGLWLGSWPIFVIGRLFFSLILKMLRNHYYSFT